MTTAGTRRRAPASRRAARKPARSIRPQIAILIEAPEWRRHVRNVAAVAERAAQAALAAQHKAGRLELCLVLADDRAVRRLNRTRRGPNNPTNVLAVPAARARGGGPGVAPREAR